MTASGQGNIGGAVEHLGHWAKETPGTWKQKNHGVHGVGRLEFFLPSFLLAFAFFVRYSTTHFRRALSNVGDTFSLFFFGR
jgi:hypothetical protein